MQKTKKKNLYLNKFSKPKKEDAENLKNSNK